MVAASLSALVGCDAMKELNVEEKPKRPMGISRPEQPESEPTPVVVVPEAPPQPKPKPAPVHVARNDPPPLPDHRLTRIVETANFVQDRTGFGMQFNVLFQDGAFDVEPVEYLCEMKDRMGKVVPVKVTRQEGNQFRADLIVPRATPQGRPYHFRIAFRRQPEDEWKSLVEWREFTLD